MKLNEQWQKRALSFGKYLEQASMNVPTMKKNFDETEISSAHEEYFSWLSGLLGSDSIKVLALSEAWCGDCVENLPVLAKLCSQFPYLELLLFSRDDNLDIMDMYLTAGKRTIPIFVFFDELGTEIGRFIERPKGATDFLESEKLKYEKLPEERRKRAVYGSRTKLRQLYKTKFRDETVKEIRGIPRN